MKVPAGGWAGSFLLCPSAASMSACQSSCGHACLLVSLLWTLVTRHWNPPHGLIFATITSVQIQSPNTVMLGNTRG